MEPTENRMIEDHRSGVRVASGINLLVGIWLFVSPWVYGAYTNPNAWNSWIVGAIIVILSAIRLNSSQIWVSYLNCLFGIWTFVSPWIYGYTGNTGRFINSLCVGVVVFILAIISANASANAVSHRMDQMHPRT